MVTTHGKIYLTSSTHKATQWTVCHSVPDPMRMRTGERESEREKERERKEEKMERKESRREKQRVLF